MKGNIKIGLEIEAIYNGLKLSLPIGGYHEGIRISHSWKSESDGSIRTTEPYGDGVEFVSDIFNSKAEMRQGLKELKRIISGSGKYELGEVMAFNHSCGSHVHVSVPGWKFRDKAIFQSLKKTRTYFLDNIRESDIESKEEIIRNYTRSYAERIDRLEYHRRNIEFNFTGEEDNRGFEWRAPNMTGIKTWAELMQFYDIIYDSIRYLVKATSKWTLPIDTDKLSIEERREFKEEGNKKTVSTIRFDKLKKRRSVFRERIIPGYTTTELKIENAREEECVTLT